MNSRDVDKMTELPFYPFLENYLQCDNKEIYIAILQRRFLLFIMLVVGVYTSVADGISNDKFPSKRTSSHSIFQTSKRQKVSKLHREQTEDLITSALSRSNYMPNA